MKKVLLIILIMYFSFPFYSLASISKHPDTNVEETCEIVFSNYGLDYRLRSLDGWMRVCNNNLFDRYIKDKDLATKFSIEACECLQEVYKSKDRDLGIFRDKLKENK